MLCKINKFVVLGQVVQTLTMLLANAMLKHLSVLKHGKYIEVFCWKMRVAFALQTLFFAAQISMYLKNILATTVNESFTSSLS